MLSSTQWHSSGNRNQFQARRSESLRNSGMIKLSINHMSGRVPFIRAVVCLAASVFAGHSAGQNASHPINYDGLATRIVSALKLGQGERVLMRTDPSYFSEIVAPLQQQIRAAGGRPLESLPVGQTLTAEIVRPADIFVELPISESGRQLSAPESAVLVRWLGQGGARRELHFHWSDGSRRTDGLPDKHPPEFDRLYQRALDIDYRALDAAQNRAIEILRLGAARVSSPAGTDLFFRTGVRAFNKQNGDASGERARSARVRVDREIELPAGALRVAPIEESVFGQIVIPEARFGTTVAKGVVLQLDNGRITRIRAKEGQEAVEQALATGGDAAYRFREFALGFNPELSESTGAVIPYYGYGAGVVRLSLGDNEELGGDVRGDFVRWFFLPDATVHVDFRYLVRGGKLVVKADER
jgi:hypothetical protein